MNGMIECGQDIGNPSDIVYTDWINAMSRLLRSYCSSPFLDSIEPLSFSFSPPRHGCISLGISSSSHCITIPFSASETPLTEIISWLERISRFNAFGRHNPQSIFLVSDGSMMTMTFVHFGWKNALTKRAHPVSILSIHRCGSLDVLFSCLCDTKSTLRSFYKSLILAADEYSDLFDDPLNWPELSCYKPLQGRMPNSAVIKGILESSPLRFL